MPAAKVGDDLAYQILGMNLSAADPVWADITDAWSAARATDEPPPVFCFRPGAWALDLTES